MGEERLPKKKAFKWNSPGRRKRNKPKKTWLYGVLEDIKEKNIPENLCEDIKSGN